MFIDRLLNQGNAPLIEQTLRFTEQRQKLLADNVANVSTPGYKQKDLDVAGFHQMLQERVDQRQGAATGSVSFDDIDGEMNGRSRGILFHDRNNRSMEQLMSDSAKNALLHNTMVELLRKQFAWIDAALREKVS